MTDILHTPSPGELRDRLVEMALGDLLGPAGGEREEVAERNVRDRYLLGVLAPARRAARAERTDAGESARTATRTGDDDAAEDDPDLPPDELAGGGADLADDGATDQDVPLPTVSIPSSFGLTFSVPRSVTLLRVEARWGQYLRESSEARDDPKTGRPLRVWRRHPRGGAFDLALDEGLIEPHATDAACPGVVVRGRVRAREDHWSITLFLVNGQEESSPRDESYLFQPELRVTTPGGEPVFVRAPLARVGDAADSDIHLEDQRIAMLHRRRVAFAVGHGVSVHAECLPGSPDRATAVMTRVVPRHELPRTAPPSAADAAANPAFATLDGLVLDMKALAEATLDEVRAMLTPLADAYRVWIDREAAKLPDPAQGLAPHIEAADAALADARRALARVEEGFALLESDPNAAEAFRFMNRAMWLQRTRSRFAEAVRRGAAPDFARDIDVPANRTWYPFQLAFILLALPGITRFDHPDRSDSPDATADLLFFPTGGGKTEAYLGLSAYTMALRRLQGTIEGRPGEPGVAVLMRYTLRLLTIQQFQRAAALLCACEVIRREAAASGDGRWGATPFRVGLWVGRHTTPNRTEDAAEAIAQLRGNKYAGATGSPYQLTACPWCGSRIEPGRDLRAEVGPQTRQRTLTYCGDRSGACPFSARQAPGEGLPVVVVDEEIYRRLPALLIATVDKFAQMPWKGEVQMLFGRVDGECERHGFHSPEIDDSTTHPRVSADVPAARRSPHPPLRPPDLIIQDELHLISGPLGTLVGLYETAIDRLCTWDVGGRRVRPKVIASTATIRNARTQVHRLFLRRVFVFPPHGLDADDSFFALSRSPSEKDPGRLYIGVCAPGRRLKAALIRTYVAFLCAAQSLYEEHGAAADPWMTLVGYFNSIRELGGMRRLVDDDVRSRARRMDERGLAKRYLDAGAVRELTSRIRSEDIPFILDLLEKRFDPALDADRKAKVSAGADWKTVPQRPLNVLLATNMISVGVDVQRLGLMVVGGQPKTTAEYIQATSRVGRAHPGVVCTVSNWARPRDLSHYETFEHYHATLDGHVESLSVTPFASGALRRGLAGLLVGLARLGGDALNRNTDAGRMTAEEALLGEAVEAIVARAEQVTCDPAVGEATRAELERKLAHWQAEARNTSGGRTLAYQPVRGKAGQTVVPLLAQTGEGRWQEFTCLNSLRDVEPPVMLVARDHGLDEADWPAPEGVAGPPTAAAEDATS